MTLGIPKETKNHEYRVAIMPSGVEALKKKLPELTIRVTENAGVGAGFTNEQYEEAGAIIVNKNKELYEKSSSIVKVKELDDDDLEVIQSGQTIFCFHHFAGNPSYLEKCKQKEFYAVSYENIMVENVRVLLTPMSRIAGCVAIEQGIGFLANHRGGSGMLVSGASGADRAHFVIIGAGAVGSNAARSAAGLGARVTLLDINTERLDELRWFLPSNVTFIHSSADTIQKYIQEADVVVGAVLDPGNKTPILLTHNHIRIMQQGSLLIDVSIDEGGISETSRPTTHDDPTYVVDGVLHYCVPNLPGIVAKTSTPALCNETMPFIEDLVLSENLFRLQHMLESVRDFHKGS